MSGADMLRRQPFNPPQAFESRTRLAAPVVVFGWRGSPGRVCVLHRRAARLRGVSDSRSTAMLDVPTHPTASADYLTVKRAIEFISKRYREQPSVEAIAEHVGLSA